MFIRQNLTLIKKCRVIGCILDISIRQMKEEEKRIIHSMVIPFLLVLLMWAVRLIQTIGGYDLSFLGIYPLKWQGLPGIITTPFIHSGFSHLIGPNDYPGFCAVLFLP
jgi:membrane associated rhomboid family serine protease